MSLLRRAVNVVITKSKERLPVLQISNRNSFDGNTQPDCIVKSPYQPINIPKTLLHHLVWKHVDKWSDKVAIECGIYGKFYKYGELRRKCEYFAAALLKIGLKSSQDVVTLILPNMPEYPIAYLGAIEAGFIVSPLNPNYTPGEISKQITDCESTCIVTHYDQLNSVLAAVKLAKPKKKLKIICIDNFDGIQRDLPAGIIRFNEMVLNGEQLSEEATSSASPEDTVLLPYSSGTTGLPKGVQLSHASIVSNLIQTTHSQMDGILESTENHQDTVPAILPFFHIYGGILIMLRGLYRGAKIVTLPKFEPKSFLDTLKNNKEIFLHAVPPMVLFLGTHPDVRGEHLDQLRCTMSGGAPCSAEDFERLLARRQHRVIQGYGLTEASPVTTYPLSTDNNLSSVGPPVVGTLAKTINWNTGESLPIGKVGEICFNGPQIMVGYHNKPKATAEILDGDGWLRTGDIGYFDHKGDLFIQDRIKELIKVKGFQVAPAELEAVLRSHPAIGDAGVTSVPCPKNGEAPVAFVVIRFGHKPPKEQEIKDYVASKVAPYKQLSRVILVESIFKSPTGKILRRKLKEVAMSV